MDVLVIGDNSSGIIALTKALLSATIGVQLSSIDMINSMKQGEPCTKFDIRALLEAKDQALTGVDEHEGAIAPAFYINKNNHTIAPHKKQRRGKFKRK